MEIQGNFEEKVLLTADGYIRKGRWNDAVHLIKYTEMIQESSPSNLTSLLISKILKDAISLVNVQKTLKVYQELKIVIEETPSVSAADKCSVYNNLACAYRTLGNLIQAKKYAEKSISLALHHKMSFTERVAFHLNLISILSDLQKYEKASEEAQKVLENFSKHSSLSESMQKLYATACFHYGNIKLKLNDPSEAIKYLRKTILQLEKLPEMSEMLKEAQQLYQSVQIEVYKKPKSRPVSANLKQKLSNRLDFARSKRSDYSIISYRKSNQNLRPASGSRIISTDMVKYQKEIDKIISRPPLPTRVKAQNSQFRITSQTGIRVLPSRPDSSNSYYHSSLSKVTTELSMETQQVVNLSRIENSNCEQISSFINSISSPDKVAGFLSFSKDLENEDREEKAVLKIQTIFRGHLARKNYKYKGKCDIIFTGKRRIGKKLFFVMIVKVKIEIIMEILNLQRLSVDFRIVLSPSQAQNIEKLLQGLELGPNGVPVLVVKGENSCFKHVQRSVKKIGEENMIVDCFSNESNEIMIKAKNFNSQKEFSVKVKRSIKDLRQDIEENIMPKLRIKDQGLILSESVDFIPSLLFEKKKVIENDEFLVGVYLKVDKFVVVVRDDPGRLLKEMEISTLKTSKSEAEIVWKKVWVKNGNVELRDSELVCEKVDNGSIEAVIEDNFKVPEKEQMVKNERSEELKDEIEENNKKIISVEGEEELKNNIFETEGENEEIIRESNQKILNLNEKSGESEEILKDSIENLEKSIQLNNENPSSFDIEEQNPEVLKEIHKNSHESTYLTKPQMSMKTDYIPRKPSNVVVDVIATEANYQDSPFEFQTNEEDSFFEEKTRFVYEGQIEILKALFKVHCKVFDSFLQISIENSLEKQSIYLKSLIIQGYPEDCTLKRILIQYVFPRLYFKDQGNKKILTCSKKFLLEIPQILLKTDSKLISEFKKSINNQEHNIKVLKNHYFYIVLSISNNGLQRFWLPFKETKNFTEESLLSTYISANISFIEGEKFALYDVKGVSVYSVFNYELSGLEFVIIVKKQNFSCFVEVHRPRSRISCSLFVEGQKFGSAGIMEIAKSLRLIEVRGEFSLISDLV